MSDDNTHTYEQSGRIFVSPDESDSNAMAYYVYAYSQPSNRPDVRPYESGDLQLLVNGERILDLSFGKTEDPENMRYDVLAALDRITIFIAEARAAYQKGNQFLQYHREK